MHRELIGIVVIGRNQSSKLELALKSVKNFNYPIVYIDSISKELNMHVASKYADYLGEIVKPLSAAKARNKGVQLLKEKNQELKYIQFIDGDCELNLEWIKTALKKIEKEEDVSIILGNLREKFSEKNIYNKLLNLEWNTPLGYVESCGGIFLCRVKDFLAVGGFNEQLQAGEEPEFCYRIRKRLGKKVLKLDIPMATHDADIQNFNQYSTRVIRNGFAVIKSFLIHKSKDFYLRELLRIVFWGFFMPFMILFSTYRFICVVFLLLQFFRVFLKLEISDLKVRLWHSFFLTFGKILEAIGLVKGLLSR